MWTAWTPTGVTPDRWWRPLWRAPAGRWPGMRWAWSLLLPVAGLMWLLTGLLAPGEAELITIRAESQVTGEGLAGAAITVGDVRYRADESGEIRIAPMPDGTEVRVSASGHESTQRRLEDGEDGRVTMSLSGVLVLGSVTDAVSGQPVDGTEITVIDAGGTPVASTRTDEAGTFVFKFIPEDASLIVRHDIYGEVVEPLGDLRAIGVELEPPPVTGRVVDQDGQGIAGARVSGPATETVTGADGAFALDGVGQGSAITVRVDELDVVTVQVAGVDLGDIPADGSMATPEGAG